MKLVVAVVGKLKEPFLAAAEAEYLKRLRPLCQLDVLEAPNEAKLLAGLPPRHHLYAWDERGEQLSSVEFAHGVLETEALRGGGAPVVFAIGGADGHSDALRAKATRLLSFGRMTLAHRLVRVLVMEQLYRGFSILRNLPYHREG